MLLEMEADPNIANKYSDTPLNIASRNGNYKDILLLEAHDAKITKPELFQAQLDKNINALSYILKSILLKNNPMSLSSEAHFKKISDILESLYEATSHDYTTDCNNKYTTIYQNVLDRGIGTASVPLLGGDDELSFDY